jgi:hypothetical protein
MEFGQPHLEVHEPVACDAECEKVRRHFARRRIYPRGEWHLWIWCCNWRVISDGHEVAWSESPDEQIVRAAGELDGRLLAEVHADGRTRTSEFVFEAGTTIQMWPYTEDDGSEDDGSQWLLYMPSGDVLAYRADGLYSLGPGNQPPEHQQWLALP